MAALSVEIDVNPGEEETLLAGRLENALSKLDGTELDDRKIKLTEEKKQFPSRPRSH